MSTIELTKIFSHLQSKCVAKGVHNSLFVVDGKIVSVKIWREYKNKCTTLLDKSVSLQNSEGLKSLLLSINEALTE